MAVVEETEEKTKRAIQFANGSKIVDNDAVTNVDHVDPQWYVDI